MFGPSVAFISAVQVVATAKTGLADTVAAMALIIVLAVAFAWLPFLAYLIAPDRTFTAAALARRRPGQARPDRADRGGRA